MAKEEKTEIIADPQQEFDEELVEGADLLDALQARLDAKEALAAAAALPRAVFKAADEAAKKIIKDLELVPGKAYRTGGHKFKVVEIEGGEVTFERAGSVRVSIGTLKPKKQKTR